MKSCNYVVIVIGLIFKILYLTVISSLWIMGSEELDVLVLLMLETTRQRHCLEEFCVNVCVL